MDKKQKISLDQLRQLEPLSNLSDERLEELISLSYVEKLPIGVSIFREGEIDNQTIYLLSGDVQLTSSDNKIDKVITSNQPEAKYPIDDSQPRQLSAIALGRIEIFRIDNSVLDYMMMWDQMAVSEETSPEPEPEVSEPATQEVVQQATQTPETARPAAPKREPENQKPENQKPEKTELVKPETKKTKAIATASEPAGLQARQQQKSEQPAKQPVKQSAPSPAKSKQTEPEKEPAQKNEAEQKPAAKQPEASNTIDESENPPAVPAAITQGDEDKSWIRKMRHIMAFKNMPPANIKALLEKMETILAKKGDVIVRQGDEGDYYYVLTEGQARVTRIVELAELTPGASFGEEALVSDNVRNASVTMNSDGMLMRLSKKDFNALLKEPMLSRVSPDEARSIVNKGGAWLDVRHAKEFAYSRLPKAINIPLHEVRIRLEELDKNKHYVCYCTTGRRSSAAAFLLVQSGYKISVLNGGVQVMAQDLVK